MHRPSRWGGLIAHLKKRAWAVRIAVWPSVFVFTGIAGGDKKLDDRAVRLRWNLCFENTLVRSLQRHGLERLLSVHPVMELRGDGFGLFVGDTRGDRHPIGRLGDSRGMVDVENHRREVVRVRRVLSARRAAVDQTGGPVLCVLAEQLRLPKFHRSAAAVVERLPDPAAVAFLQRPPDAARPSPFSGVVDSIDLLAAFVEQSDGFAIVPQAPDPRAGDVVQRRMLFSQPVGIGCDDQSGSRRNGLVVERKLDAAVELPTGERNPFFAVIPKLNEFLGDRFVFRPVMNLVDPNLGRCGYGGAEKKPSDKTQQRWS